MLRTQLTGELLEDLTTAGDEDQAITARSEFTRECHPDSRRRAGDDGSRLGRGGIPCPDRSRPVVASGQEAATSVP